jgi:hypothetical protein
MVPKLCRTPGVEGHPLVVEIRDCKGLL